MADMGRTVHLLKIQIARRRIQYAVWYGLSNMPFVRQSPITSGVDAYYPMLGRGALVNSHVHNRDPRDSEFTMGNGSSISNPGG